MNSLHFLDNSQLSDTLLEANVRKLNKDFLAMLKKEVINRLIHSSHCEIRREQKHEQFIFSRELERLYQEYANCTDAKIREAIYQDILLLKSVVEMVF